MSEVLFTLLVVGDMHFKTNNIKETKILMETILQSMKDFKPDMVVFLGDTLDSFEKIHLQLQTKAINFFKKCAAMEGSPEIYVLIGNHDRCNNQIFLTDEHPFAGLIGALKNLKIVDTPKDVFVGDRRITFCPYVPEDRFFEALDKLKKPISSDSKIDLLFAHEDFDKIKGEKLKHIKMIISGHIHDYKKSGNIFYPGTPYQHTFGESENKGLQYLEFYKNGKIENQRIELKIAKKKTIEVTAEEIEEMDLSKMKKTRVIVKGKNVGKDVIDALKERGNKLVLKDTAYVSDGKNFKEILTELIGDSKEQMEIFKLL